MARRRSQPGTDRSAIAVFHIGWSSRGGPGSTTTVGPVPLAGGTTRPGAVPTGSSTVAPSGITACLRFDARTASASRPGQRRIIGRRIASISSLEPRVEHHLAAAEAADDLGRQVVGSRTEPAARDDQRHPPARHILQGSEQVIRAVADDLDHRGVDAELAQALGQPRTVAVGDDPGQDLGSGDEDARPGSHTHRGCLEGGNGVVPLGCSMKPIDDAEGLTFTLAPFTFI